MFEHTTIYFALTKRATFTFSIQLPPVFQLITWRRKRLQRDFFQILFPIQIQKGHKYILGKESDGALFCFITSLASQCILFHHCYDHPPKIEMLSIKKMRNKRGQTFYDSRIKNMFLLQLSLITLVALYIHLVLYAYYQHSSRPMKMLILLVCLGMIMNYSYE